MKNTLEKLNAILDDYGFPESTLETQIDSLEVDSLDKVEIMMNIEENFVLVFDQNDEEAFAACKTIGDVVALIDKYLP